MRFQGDQKTLKINPWIDKWSQKRSQAETGGRTGRQGGRGTRVKGLKDEGRADDHPRQRAEGPANFCCYLYLYLVLRLAVCG